MNPMIFMRFQKDKLLIGIIICIILCIALAFAGCTSTTPTPVTSTPTPTAGVTTPLPTHDHNGEAYDTGRPENTDCIYCSIINGSLG